MNALSRSRALSSLLALACAAGAGCSEEKKPQAEASDAGQGPAKPVLDSKLAAAVKAAESAQPAAAAKGQMDGPPESGIFAAGVADKAFPPGAPPKLEVLGEGAEPKARLAPAPADEQKETVSVTVRLQGGRAIPVEYGLALKVDKPKDEKKTEGPKIWRVVGKVAAIGVPPQLPRDSAEQIGKLKGTEVRYAIGPDGALSELSYTMSKDANPALGDAVVRGLVDAISVAMPPFPSKPVGVGAYWMVTDRATTIGTDVVRYRVYRLEKLDKDGASLSVDVRQYATKDVVELGPMADVPKLTIQHFESNGKGKVDWTPQSLLPVHGETTQKTGFAGNLPGPGGQPQQAMLQTEVTARFAAEQGDKKK